MLSEVKNLKSIFTSGILLHSPEIETALTNWSNDIIEGITQTVKKIHKCYLKQTNVHPENK